MFGLGGDAGGVQCCSGGRQCNSALDDSDTMQYYFRYDESEEEFATKSNDQFHAYSEYFCHLSIGTR